MTASMPCIRSKEWEPGGRRAMGTIPCYQIVAPDSTAMKLNGDGTTLPDRMVFPEKEGDLVSASLTLSAPRTGAEIIYSDSSSDTSKFYIRIPVALLCDRNRKVTSSYRQTARILQAVHPYGDESIRQDAQNITFLERHTTDRTKIQRGEVSIKLIKRSGSGQGGFQRRTLLSCPAQCLCGYKDRRCHSLSTDAGNGRKTGAACCLRVYQDTGNRDLKEITRPQRIPCQPTADNVKLVANQTASVTVPR
ncbi:MAG: hypothetical protein ACLTER_12835 [Ruminococcus sp.]